MQPRRPSLAAALLCLVLLAPAARAQISRARTHDTHWISTGSKFLGRRAENDDEDRPK